MKDPYITMRACVGGMKHTGIPVQLGRAGLPDDDELRELKSIAGAWHRLRPRFPDELPDLLACLRAGTRGMMDALVRLEVIGADRWALVIDDELQPTIIRGAPLDNIEVVMTLDLDAGDEPGR
jgi:hypothetical protein